MCYFHVKTIGTLSVTGTKLFESRGNHRPIGDVRGKGLIIGVEMVKDQEKKTPAPEEAVKIRDLCRGEDVLLGHGGFKNDGRLKNYVRIIKAALASSRSS